MIFLNLPYQYMIRFLKLKGSNTIEFEINVSTEFVVKTYQNWQKNHQYLEKWFQSRESKCLSFLLRQCRTECCSLGRRVKRNLIANVNNVYFHGQYNFSFWLNSSWGWAKEQCSIEQWSKLEISIRLRLFQLLRSWSWSYFQLPWSRSQALSKDWWSNWLSFVITRKK